ncbi:MAG: hypothetical protein KDD64_17125, partial [Bdellovibrionales bacterium]|nr:hypothetical protein [Bdellovibrionales bacterium]
MYQRENSPEFVSIRKLSQVLLLSFSILLILEVLPKGIERRSIRLQRQYNEVIGATGSLRALSQRISFFALARLSVTNPKLQISINEKLENALEEFLNGKELLKEELIEAEFFSDQGRKSSSRGLQAIDETLGRFAKAASSMLGDLPQGLDDMDFLLLLGESTSETFEELGNIARRLEKESERTLERLRLFQDIILFLTVGLLFGVGFYVIFFLPKRMREDLGLRLEAERALKVQLQDLERFSSTVAHDLRSPLHNIHNAGVLLKERIGSEGTRKSERELCDIIVEQSEQLSQMIRALLSFARSQTHRITKEKISLQELVERVRKRFYEDLSSGRLRLSCQTDISLRVEPTLFENVLQNLIENSLRHSGQASVEVTLDAFREESGKRSKMIVYRDNGKGIPGSLRQQVFENFVRGEDAKVEGLGLG